MACAGSVAMEAPYPDTSSEFADEGTAAHFLASECLAGEHDAAFFVGKKIVVWEHATKDESGTAWQENVAPNPEVTGRVFTVDADMARHVQKYLNHVRQYADGGELHVEQRLPFFGGDSGVPEQFGTSDSVIVLEAQRRLVIADLKYGKGVQVDAFDIEYDFVLNEDGSTTPVERRTGNKQLMLYALGALNEFGLLYEFDDVLLVIDQPRLDHLSEWVVTVAELREFEQRAIAAAKLALTIGPVPATNEQDVDEDSGHPFIRTTLGTDQIPVEHLRPGPDQCRFCKAKGACPALRDQVLATVAGDFDNLDEKSVLETMIELGEIAVSIADAEKIIAAAHGVAPKAVDFEMSNNSDANNSYFVVKKPTIRPVLDGVEAKLATLDDQHLAVCAEALDMVESWCKGVRAELERRLLAGVDVPGFKLVEGKQGNRAWTAEEEARAMLKSFRLKVEEMHDLSLISPTTAEKLHAAGRIGERQWKKLQAIITRSVGKPSVAPASDKRPALAPKFSNDDFDPVADDGCADLL